MKRDLALGATTFAVGVAVLSHAGVVAMFGAASLLCGALLLGKVALR